MLPHDKYVMPKHIIKYLFVAFFIMFFSTIIITPLYFALNYDLLPKAPIYRLVLGEIIPHPITKNNLHYCGGCRPAVVRLCGGSAPRPDLSQGTEWNVTQ